MDTLHFLSLLTFQITVIALVAIVFNQTKLAEKAIAGLTELSSKLFPKNKKQNRN